MQWLVYLINKCTSPPGGISFCRTLIRFFIAMWITGLSEWIPGDDFGLDLELGLVFGLDFWLLSTLLYPCGWDFYI
jgi:hypothetical protein